MKPIIKCSYDDSSDEFVLLITLNGKTTSYRFDSFSVLANFLNDWLLENSNENIKNIDCK